ncbi:MAG: LysR family transcriptional regulator [Kofleriaceae bacterium]|nr:LysR family transcriptional regulator [Kofleriaceae bacterium]
MPATPPNPFELDALRVFVEVAERASFSKAAKKLGITKSTASRAIARLERHVGAELLHRDTHKVAMSTAGVALFERVAPHLAALAGAIRELPEHQDTPSGLLRVTCSVDVGMTLLPGLIARFRLRHPEVTFDLHISDQVVDLVGEGFDLAIRAAPRGLADSSLTVRKLGAAELGFFASPTYLARRGAPKEIGDPEHDWIAFRPAASAIMPKRAAAHVLADNFVFVRELAVADGGVAGMPTFVAEPEVSAGRLVSVLQGRTLRSSGGFFLLYPSRGQTPRKLAAFCDFLIEYTKAKPFM